MKAITTKKEKSNTGGILNCSTVVFVNEVRICSLTKLDKGHGFDTRSKFMVRNFDNELGLKFTFQTARSIKQVIAEIESKTR